MAKEYIEREAAKRELLSWAVSINHPEYLIKDDALHIIDSIPAADVAPVRHGRWEKISIDISDDLFRCSECGHLVIIPPDTEYEFYPTCRAKIDGGEV